MILIRPRLFAPNPSTAADNSFQATSRADAVSVAATAYDEVTGVAAALEAHGVRVHLFEDEERHRPDSVFPNNWLSTHAGGHVAIYPMYSPNRRREQRTDVIQMLKQRYRVQVVVDYSGLEQDDVFLEGTGAMVIDHASRIAYTCRSARADGLALERFCTDFGYEPIMFDASDEHGVPVYHTNVMMCIATDFALVGLDLIESPERRTVVATRLAQSGKTVVELNRHQVGEFAGNAIELKGRDGRILALSSRALASLTVAQRDLIEQSCTILPLHVPTIELAGGSVRCMIAGIHLDSR